MTENTIQMPADYFDGWVERETIRKYAEWNKALTCGLGCCWDARYGRFIPEAGCPEHDPSEGGKVP